MALQVMHLCYSGDLVVESSENGEVSSRFARKWEIFGLQSALGLRSGPADYKLLAPRPRFHTLGGSSDVLRRAVRGVPWSV